MAIGLNTTHGPRFPLLTLLHPRTQSRLLVVLLIVGVLLSSLGVTEIGLPVWLVAMMTLVLLLYPAVRKWRDDEHRWGIAVMVLSILLTLQGLHTVEHIIQWSQFHLLGWPAKASSGLISPGNAEVVHFVWNWAVLCAVIYLVRVGMRNVWAWLLLAWALAHTLEHTYLFAQYLQEVARLTSLGQPISQAQGLPGVLGKGGWLAARQGTPGLFGFVCTLAPPLTTAPRLDIHFWWNAGETVLLLSAAHMYLARYLRSRVVQPAHNCEPLPTRE